MFDEFDTYAEAIMLENRRKMEKDATFCALFDYSIQIDDGRRHDLIIFKLRSSLDNEHSRF